MNLARFLGIQADAPEPIRSGSPRDVQRLATLCHHLLSATGEVSAIQLSRETVRLIRALSPEARSSFVDVLASRFGVNTEAVRKAAAAYGADPSARNLAVLQTAAESPRLELFRRMNISGGALHLLVQLRGHILEDGRPSWQPVEDDLRNLFQFWFNRGLLTLERIDWRSPAVLLEKLIEYEAVHEIQGFRDLRRRLEADRRCYGFFHPAMPDEPVMFVEIALTRGIGSKIGPLLNPNADVGDPMAADCAVFYSITNCQPGLRGVPLGSLLLKQVVDDLRLTLPGLRRFMTLSPIPGLGRWLREQPDFLRVSEHFKNGDWPKMGTASKELERVMSSLCAGYLLHAKRGKEPLDPVARFHLRNGARLERIHWLADLSARALKDSYGMMVNYVYRPREIEANHEAYTQKHQIAADSRIEFLARKSLSARKPILINGD
jgi:malonyl-CoA decarboxylase